MAPIASLAAPLYPEDMDMTRLCPCALPIRFGAGISQLKLFYVKTFLVQGDPSGRLLGLLYFYLYFIVL